MMSSISVIILAKNEEQHIKDCIESAQFADEVLIIDDYSMDKTVEIAESMGARVVSHAMDGDWSQQRRFAINMAMSEWIFFLDADERISIELQREIQDVLDKNEIKAYRIKRSNVFHHNKVTHGVLRPDYVLRFMPKEGCHIEGLVHETISSIYPETNLQGYIYHYTYDNWHQYFNKFNNYTTLAAKKYKEDGKSFSFIKDIIIRPSWAFFKVYILDKGFLDGKMGFILSINHYFYTMTKYVKLYYLLKSNGRL